MAKRHAEAMKKSQELEHRNPQIAIDALLPANATIGGKPTLPLTLAHYVILEKINSPLVSGKSLDWKDVDNLDLMKMCYVVTHKASDCRDILAEGSEAFESAVFEFCENIPLSQMYAVGQALGGLLAAATAPAVSAQGEKKTKRRA